MDDKDRNQASADPKIEALEDIELDRAQGGSNFEEVKVTYTEIKKVTNKLGNFEIQD
ncbi:MAG: hypothetical protein KDJ77_04840 [Rhodobiaceae bacterium]|nr:hypothetical protein [Rhodobiaceae bacterium]